MKLPTGSLDQFIDTCHDAVRRGLVTCSSGNLSMRVGHDTMLVTTTRTWIGQITSDQITCCRISDGAVLEGNTPTVEIAFHAGILRERPDVNAVLHFQSPNATALACRQDLDSINFNVIPEVPFYMGKVGIIPYITPGSQELADAVVEVMTTHDIAVMKNHGLVTVARECRYTIQNAEFIELASSIIIRNGTNTQPLPEAAVDNMLQASPYDSSAKV